MSDEEILKSLCETFRLNPDASPIQAVAEVDADPDRWLDAAETLADGGEPEVPAEHYKQQGDESDDADLNQQNADEDDPVLVNDDGPWGDVDWTVPDSSVWPPELLDREQWMGRGGDGKMPFAPWGDRDAPAECNATDCPADRADEDACDCDARWKWSHEDFYVDGETVAMAEDDPALDGRVFIQQESDPYAFVDGDDVRDPETGEVHPGFVDILNRLGVSYADISTSGGGVHVNYRGALPNDIPEAKWELDDEPFGANDDPPAVEIYANKHVCVATGDHVPGSGTEVREWDDDAVRDLLDENDALHQTTTDRSGVDIEDYEPTATDSDETTDDIRDIFRALDRLDPKRVGERTIVREWTQGRRSFLPTWGSSDDGGTANYIDTRIWHDTGRDGGYGGPAVMAAIDAGLIGHAGAEPGDVSGETFFEALEHLRELGFDIPKLNRGPESNEHEFDIVSDDRDDDVAAAEAAAVAGADDPAPAARSETDGGTVTDESADSGPSQSKFERFAADVRAAVEMVASDDEMTQRTARHRIAKSLVHHYDYVYPEEEVRGWRTVLYSYDDETGVYEPRGATDIQNKLERAAGDFVTNQVTNEIVGKVERMTVERGQRFERSPERLVVKNGILDLHTGELDPFTPAEYHRQSIPIAWNPDAGDPGAIDDFLHDIVGEGDVPTLYRLIAHTLYKEYVGEKAAILIGSGQNGKSVFLDVVEEFLGPWNVTHRELQDFDDDSFAANNLEGKLANLATEIGEQQLKDTTTFKKLTGRDTLDANVKFEKPITFENYASLMFATNEMPVFGQDNHAIWRRWVYVDFPYTFDATDPSAKDPVDKSRLMRRLTQERELQALLLRCQQEIQRWHEEAGAEFFADAMPPEEVRDKMKKAAEPVYAFASTCLSVGDEDDTHVKKSIARAAYRAYADEEDLPTIPENTFGERLLGLRDYPIDPGQKRIDGSPTHVYRGVELSARGRQVLGLDTPDDEGQSQVDDAEQATAIVMRELRAMVEENDNQPVPRNGVVWRCAGEIGKTTAENALDNLLNQKGRVMEGSDGVLPVDA